MLALIMGEPQRAHSAAGHRSAWLGEGPLNRRQQVPFARNGLEHVDSSALKAKFRSRHVASQDLPARRKAATRRVGLSNWP